MFIAAFANPNSFGRLAAYFEPFTLVALPGILKEIARPATRLILQPACCVAYLIFYFFSYMKQVRNLGWDSDFYEHVGILHLFFP